MPTDNQFDIWMSKYYYYLLYITLLLRNHDRWSITLKKTCGTTLELWRLRVMVLIYFYFSLPHETSLY